MLAARSPTTRTVMSYFRIIETGVVARLFSSDLKRGRPVPSSSGWGVFFTICANDSGEFVKILRQFC
jgi:hypothetical protein